MFKAGRERIDFGKSTRKYYNRDTGSSRKQQKELFITIEMAHILYQQRPKPRRNIWDMIL